MLSMFPLNLLPSKRWFYFTKSLAFSFSSLAQTALSLPIFPPLPTSLVFYFLLLLKGLRADPCFTVSIGDFSIWEDLWSSLFMGLKSEGTSFWTSSAYLLIAPKLDPGLQEDRLCLLPTDSSKGWGPLLFQDDSSKATLVWEEGLLGRLFPLFWPSWISRL